MYTCRALCVPELIIYVYVCVGFFCKRDESLVQKTCMVSYGKKNLSFMTLDVHLKKEKKSVFRDTRCASALVHTLYLHARSRAHMPHPCTQACTPPHTHMQTNTHVHTHTHIRTHTHIHTHTHTHIHTHTHAHTHTHTHTF